uniref:DNA cross-link repair 1A protein n=1 Tax=Echeneis naucrates TaxID=173247 RepID=A0A665VHJ8_ECHNA
MSQTDDSEKDIWDYKPLKKKKKRPEPPAAVKPVTKRRCTLRKTSDRHSALPVRAPGLTGEGKTAPSGHLSIDHENGRSSSDIHTKPSKLPAAVGAGQTDNAAQAPTSGDSCPICQMPFAILVVQTQRWHVAECLEVPRDKCKECPHGLQCSSTIPNHYKNFNHTLLAHSRANSDMAVLSLSQQAETSEQTGVSCLSGLTDNDGDESAFESSQNSTTSQSVAFPCNNTTGTPQSKQKNGLLFLRSPGPEDIKKKKGWSSSPKGYNSISASQESKSDFSSIPVKEDAGEQASEGFPKCEPSDDEVISYSPLSELPAETEVINSESEKVLNCDPFENEDNDSPLLFYDGFSSEDELLTEFIDNLEGNNVPEKDPSSSNIKLVPVTSLAPTNHLASVAVGENRADSTGEEEARGKLTNVCSSSIIQSPQSIVLERLRESLLNSNNQHLKNLDDGIHKAGQASCLKQTDIGVFFGLKPLKEKKKEENETGYAQPALNTTSITSLGESSGKIRQRRGRMRISKARTTDDTSQGTETGNSTDVVNAQGEVKRDWTRGWRRRRNRVNADGEVELPRCPFYKKIPGTKFVVDAFQYGEIEGIAAYFLSHFHSDHYGGLTKNSTFPIYCNRITGNLVKNKLKVAEKYLHILPMNTQVTVEGIKVILLDANHCPGAAMLLFFLPNGQTVLHTGDFRADPSMESYPELLSCRVQTLYLDTTYCSPEYTFPRQQEVINFAASTAFELVTLNPCTLVVCGSYSVGKEKVFLALADVLGSKVCLSRDKYNTMCCLESEQVRQCITTDWKAAQVHVLPMMQLTFKKLKDHLARFSQRYNQLVAFKPTGWTFSQQVNSVGDIQPETRDNISIYGIPYSEHSSFLELKRFVQWIQPVKIIPTVNNGSWASRKAMEKCFSEWLMETKAKL